MINIYRLLHIFTNEDIEKYNKMLLGIDLELQMLISEYPGGAEVTRYLAYLKGQDTSKNSPALDVKEIAEEEAKARILADALAAKDAQTPEKVMKIQVETTPQDAFSSALPPVPVVSNIPTSTAIENVMPSSNGGSMEQMIDALAKVQAKANEKNTISMSDAISKAITASQESSTNIIANALSRLGGAAPNAPIDVSYSPVTQSENFDTNLLTSFASDISEKITNSIANAITSSQENNTKALVDAIANIKSGAIPDSADNKNSLASFASDISDKIANSVSTAIITSQETNSKTLSEIVTNIFTENKGMSAEEMASAITRGLQGTSFNFMRSNDPDNKEMVQSPNMGITQDMIDYFAKAFSDAQIQASQAQTDNLAEAFAKAVTLSQSEISSSLQEIVTEISKENASLSADEISIIISDAINKLQESRLLSDESAEHSTDIANEMSQTMDKLMSSFSDAQLQISQTQSENIEKIIETVLTSHPAIKEQQLLDSPNTEQKNITDTYKETWIGGDFSSQQFDDEMDINSDVFEGNISMDNDNEVSLKDAMYYDPYNVLLKQKKIFKDHKILYDSDVGLHIAYSGIKNKGSKE